MKKRNRQFPVEETPPEETPPESTASDNVLSVEALPEEAVSPTTDLSSQEPSESITPVSEKTCKETPEAISRDVSDDPLESASEDTFIITSEELSEKSSAAPDKLFKTSSEADVPEDAGTLAARHAEDKQEKIKKGSRSPSDKKKKEKVDCDALTKISDPVSPGALYHPEEVQAEPAKNKKLKPIKKKRHPNSSIYAFTATTLYLFLVIVSAVLLSIFALDVANDAFGLRAKGVPVDITITGEYITIDDLAEQLYAQHVIRHPTIFVWYAKLRHKSNVEFVAGTVEDVPPQTGYDQLLALFSPRTEPRKEITIAIPEGYTVDNIIDLFVNDYHLGTREAFEYVINEYPFSPDDYWFLEGVEKTPDRIYRLEGYLFPDTYRFYDYYTDKEEDIPGTAAAKAVVIKLLNQFNKNFKKSYLKRSQEYLKEFFPDAPEMTLDQIITLASIIEKEGLPEERATISAVFYNRMCNPLHEGIGGKLESDATAVYYLRHHHLPETDQNIVQCDTLYNTRNYPGLPPGPIVSPSFESINAALYPLSGCSYYFFVATDSGYSFFAETLAEHLDNVQRAAAGEVADPFGEGDWEDQDEQ